MDKFEYKVRADEIKELIARGEYPQAAEIADTIDWRRVKSVMMLCTISDLYKINRRYEDAKNLLMLAYERRPGGRTICYSLCELSIKMEEYVQAVEFYKEFVQIAPKDPGRYILQYKLYEAQEVSLEERIEVLEELKRRDYREKWAYELAYLYHRIGLGTRCVEECDEMILWFGEGKYVIKAMELKRLHEPLTPQQQEKYNNRFCNSEEVEETEAVEEIPTDKTIIYEPVSVQTIEQPVDTTEEPQAEELDIHVKTMDVGKFNTINLQEELAESVMGVLTGEGIDNPITRSIVAPIMDSDTESLDYPQIEEVEEEDLEPAVEEMEGSEVFFGETGEFGAWHKELQQVSPKPEDEEVVETADEIPLEEESVTEEANTEEVVAEGTAVVDATAAAVMEQMRQSAILNAEPPKELASVLSQEADGQLSLVMPERENVEKQITGQMNIEEVLAEWERVKKENEEKRKEEVRQHVLQQTGSMFTEFEMAVRDGLLEKIEKGTVGDDYIDKLVRDFVERPEQETEAVIEPEVTDSEEAYESEEAEPEEAYEFEETEAEEFYESEEAVSEEIYEPEEADFEAYKIAESENVEYLESESLETMLDIEPEEMLEESEEEIEEIVWDVEEPSEDTQESEEPELEVERDKEKIRNLTKDEKELYGPFIQSRSAKEQLVRAIDNISMAAYTGNVIITGEEGMDTLSLAKNMICEVQMTDSNFSGKVAKISGNALNNKDVAEIVEALNNGALIITNASQMNSDTTGALSKALEQEMLGIIVIMMDIRKSMDYFLEEQEELGKYFTARMDVEALNNDTLTAFGIQYARELEYSIDEMGMLALHTRIEELQTSEHVATVVDVKQIVDEAIRHVNRKTMGHFFDILVGKRYDSEDMIILGEKDFI